MCEEDGRMDRGILLGKGLLTIGLVATQLGPSCHALESSPLSGKAELKSLNYLNRTEDYPNSAGQGFFRLEKSWEKDSFGVKLAPAVLVDVQRLDRDQKIRSHWLASEVRLDYSSAMVEYSLGRQAITWGTADGISPLNGFRALDLSDPYSPRELTQTAASLRLRPDYDSRYLLELVFVPSATSDYLPFDLRNGRQVDVESSRWGVVIPRGVDFGTSRTDLDYQVQNSRKTLQDFGARFRVLQVKNWDFSLAAGKFARKRPILTYSLAGNADDPTSDLTVNLISRHPRYRMTGLDATGSIGEWGMRFEFADNRVDRRDEAFGYNSRVLSSGIDRLFSGLILKTDFYFNASYVIVALDRASSFDKSSIDLNFTRNYSTLKLEFRRERLKFGEDLFLSESGNSLANTFCRLDLRDDLAVFGVFSVARGSLRRNDGALDNNNRLQVGVDYIF